mmetsp:Transcript_22784/g.65521  ORF Transcript_22784/g.65521 Transcript_22784/m.65521 type:complete len:235 (-) Transcript_22784:1902-2606(-)
MAPSVSSVLGRNVLRPGPAGLGVDDDVVLHPLADRRQFAAERMASSGHHEHIRLAVVLRDEAEAAAVPFHRPEAHPTLGALVVACLSRPPEGLPARRRSARLPRPSGGLCARPSALPIAGPTPAAYGWPSAVVDGRLPRGRRRGRRGPPRRRRRLALRSDIVGPWPARPLVHDHVEGDPRADGRQLAPECAAAPRHDEHLRAVVLLDEAEFALRLGHRSRLATAAGAAILRGFL